MFESAELGHAVDKETYKKELPALREALLEVQTDVLRSARFPVIILISGVDGAGKGETVNILNEWMDPRHIRTHALDEPSAEERARLQAPGTASYERGKFRSALICHWLGLLDQRVVM